MIFYVVSVSGLIKDHVDSKILF